MCFHELSGRFDISIRCLSCLSGSANDYGSQDAEGRQRHDPTALYSGTWVGVLVVLPTGNETFLTADWEVTAGADATKVPCEVKVMCFVCALATERAVGVHIRASDYGVPSMIV
jgi:hypothetical protein